MITSEETILMRAIALCFKPFLKPEEAMIYCNLGRTQFSKRCQEMGINKNAGGYFKREDLDMLCAGGGNKICWSGCKAAARQAKRGEPLIVNM